MSKIRINELARQLEVKSREVIEKLRRVRARRESDPLQLHRRWTWPNGCAAVSYSGDQSAAARSPPAKTVPARPLSKNDSWYEDDGEGALPAGRAAPLAHDAAKSRRRRPRTGAPAEAKAEEPARRCCRTRTERRRGRGSRGHPRCARRCSAAAAPSIRRSVRAPLCRPASPGPPSRLAPRRPHRRRRRVSPAGPYRAPPCGSPFHRLRRAPGCVLSGSAPAASRLSPGFPAHTRPTRVGRHGPRPAAPRRSPGHQLRRAPRRAHWTAPPPGRVTRPRAGSAPSPGTASRASPCAVRIQPMAGQPMAGQPLAGQPMARPIVPPRPDLAARLGQQPQRSPMPGRAPLRSQWSLLALPSSRPGSLLRQGLVAFG